jgi:hypothetical protein
MKTVAELGTIIFFPWLYYIFFPSKSVSAEG